MKTLSLSDASRATSFVWIFQCIKTIAPIKSQIKIVNTVHENIVAVKWIWVPLELNGNSYVRNIKTTFWLVQIVTDFQTDFSDICDGQLTVKVDASARAKAKEEVATSEEVTSIHAVKPSASQQSFYAVVNRDVIKFYAG